MFEKYHVKYSEPYQAWHFQLFAWHGGRGGSEARMPKIKVIINQLKVCMSHTYKSMPDAKFESGSFLFLDIWRHKISLRRGNESPNSGIYRREMGLTLK